MGMRIIAGPPGSGKTRTIISEILAKNAEDPLGPPLILLVPEQATFQTERLLLTSGSTGYVRIEVLSFARLGRWIEARRPRAKLPVLNDVHREVIVTGVLARLKREGAGEGLAAVPHLESSVAALLGEMKQGNVRTGELMEWAEKVEPERPALARKLRQLAEVARGFEEAVARRFEDPQDTMLSLAASVKGIDDLQGAHVYVDSFFGFTAVEREVLRGLLAGFPQVTVTLVLDRSIADAVSALEIAGQGTGRCAPAMETLQQLIRIAEQESATGPELVDVSMADESMARFQAPELHFLSREFLAGSRRNHWMNDAPNVQLIEAMDIRDQARAAAMQIECWHRERGWNWGDMAIIARDVDSVAQELGEALDTFRIPHFMDRSQPEETHPVVQGSLAALEAVLRGWRQESVLAFAKSGLYGFDVYAVARLEWFALQYARREVHWKQREPWGAPPERSPFEPGEGRRHQVRDMEGLDAMRRDVAHPLLALEARLEAARTPDGGLPARAVIEALCRLIHQGMQPQLDEFVANDELDKAGGEEKVLAQIGRLMDAIAAAAGDDAFDDLVLLDLLRSILGKFRLQRIPPLLDQVVVAQADRSRLHEVRGVVVIGLAEGLFPAPGSNRSLLSDEDRETLAQFTAESGREKEIRASAREMFRREAFFAWMALARAGGALTLIRPAVARDGEALKPSPWWIEVTRLFPRLQEQTTSDTPATDQVARAREVAALVCTQWGRTTSRRPLVDATVLARHAPGFHTAASREEFRRVVSWATKRNEAILSRASIEEAIGEEWSASATALESFASCPFQFFMRTLMRPDVRQETQVNRLDLGNLAHAVLKNVFDRVRAGGMNLGDMGAEEATHLVDECFAAPLERLQQAGLLDTPMGSIQADLMRGQVVEVVQHFGLLAQHSGLRNIHTEIVFSSKEDDLNAPVIRVAMHDGRERSVPLRGQIDRVDEWGTQGWLFVLDYKLTTREVDWTAVVDGKALQLPIYLLVLEENREALAGPNARIGGAFYEAITRGSDKPNRLRGVMRQTALQELHLDDSDAAFKISGARNRKDVTTSGDLLQDEHMAALIEWSNRKITQHIESILNGECHVHPVRIRNWTPCGYCDHQMACRLDYAMNVPRVAEKLTKQQALARIAGSAKGEDE